MKRSMVANAVADVASPEIPLAITGLLASPANPLLPAHQTGTSNRLLTIPVNIGAKAQGCGYMGILRCLSNLSNEVVLL